MFLKKKLFGFIWKLHHYAFCNKEEQTLLHIFSECFSVIYFLHQLTTSFKNNLILPAPTPQTALLGLWNDATNHDKPIINHVLLIFKLHLCNSSERHRLNIMNLLNNIKKKIDRILFIFQQWKNKRFIKINDA